jgi:hypothetical protein
VVEGVPVGVFLLSRDEREAAFEKIALALALLRRHCPRRFAHLRRDVGCVLVLSASGLAGVWIDRLRVCELNVDYLLDAAPADVASTLAHEAMHARLYRRGLGYTEGGERARIEAACYRAERAFARRLPPAIRGPEMAEKADRCVRALLDPSSDFSERYYSDKAYFAAKVQGLRGAGTPEWLVRAAVAMGRRHQRRRR